MRDRLRRELETRKLRAGVSTCTLNDEDARIRHACETSFYEFVRHAWVHIEGRPFIGGWHVEALCAHLQAVQMLEIRDLLINLPPRMGKSSIVNVLFPAWCWTIEPNLRFFFTSYAQNLSIRDSVACRRLILSEWYQKLWGHTFRLMDDQNAKIKFDNNKQGYRLTSSVGAATTGMGGDILCADDPNSASNVHSKVSRDETNNWWDYVFSTRFSNAKTVRKILVQQRLHENDCSGHILAKNDPTLVHLCLPMQYEKARTCVTVKLPSLGGKIWMDPRKKEGELLWPEGIGEEELEKIKRNFNYDSYTIAGQLQQSPSPAEGGILNPEWLKMWKHKDLPEFEYVLQSWDTALTSSATSCYSACTTWGVFKDAQGIYNLMLISLFREKVEYPDLRKMATRLARNVYDVYMDDPQVGQSPPNLILIEAKVSGYSLLADLMRANLPVMSFNPNKHGDKIGRARIVSHLLENGLVHLPSQEPACQYYTQDSQDFLNAVSTFPNSESNDIIDSMSQALIYLTNNGWVLNRHDPEWPTAQTGTFRTYQTGTFRTYI